MFILKIFKYLIQSIFIYLFFIIIKIFGLNLSRKVFSFIFFKIGPTVRSEKIIDNNLEKFLGSQNSDIKKDIKIKMWNNYGKTFVEYLYLKTFRNMNTHIEIKGEEILNEINKQDKPVIFVSGHFANFELMSMEITRKNINLATIYRPLNNFFINPLMEYLRKKYVCKNQIKKGLGGVKEIISYINKKYSIALMIDQRVSEGEKINFFNEEAFTTTLPAQMALKFDLDIVPIFIERKNNSFFSMHVYKPLKPSEFSDKLEITYKLNQILESMIIKNPNQWIWTHDRWK